MAIIEPKRRWLRYSLRSMLVVVLVLSVWLGVNANRAARQRKIEAFVQELGGEVQFDAPFHHVVIILRGVQLTEDDLVALVDLVPELDNLNLAEANVSDAGLKRLALLKRLKVLSLDATNITDAGLRDLRACRSLEALFLRNTRITDAGLIHLIDLKKLSTLDISNTCVTDAGLVHLRRVPSLWWLSIGGNDVTDEAASRLQTHLPHLRSLMGP